MNKKIFFSWQSDIPHVKRIIRKSLQKVVRNHNQKIEYEYVIDEATRKKSGAINIAETIFTKIETSNIFIGDLSIVNYTEANAKSKIRINPNPNVLLELGYAASSIGWERIILLMDEEYISYIPFDIKNRRVILYNFKQKSHISLDHKLANAIKSIEEYESSIHSVIMYTNSKIDILFINIFTYISYLFPNLIDKSRGQMGTLQLINFISKKGNKQIAEILKKQNIVAFHAYLSIDYLNRNIESLLNNIFISNNLSKRGYSILIELLFCINRLEIGKVNIWKLAEIDDTVDKFLYKVENGFQSNMKKLILVDNLGQEWLSFKGEFKFDYTNDELLKKGNYSAKAEMRKNIYFV